MQRLIDFIRLSRTWTDVARGKELIERVAKVLHKELDIDTGMFLYRRRYIPEDTGRIDTRVRVYAPWGFRASEDELSALVPNSPWYQEGIGFLADASWHAVDELPIPWRNVFEASGARHIGAWPLTSKEECVGVMVFGRRKGALIDDADELSLCATQISLFFDLIVARRIAEDLSNRDPLTGIFNRRGLLNRLPIMQASAAQENDKLVVAMLDVNDFKSINDVHGHARGDAVLEDIARTLVALVDDRSGIAARFGGDEFVFVLASRNLSAEQIREQVLKRFASKEYNICVGAVIWDEGMEWAECLEHADSHLYERKATVHKEEV